MVLDPVCKLEVEPGTAVASSNYQGRTYHFCSAQCKSYFDRNPSKYVKAEQKKKESLFKRLFK